MSEGEQKKKDVFAKLTVEIKGNQFCYEYEVATSRYCGTRELCADSFAAFTELMKVCYRHWDYKDKQRDKQILEEAWKREWEEKIK